MATKVVMAQLSPTMEEGKLVEWKVKEGDEVSQGDVLAEVETDKANMDIEAMAGGVMRALLASAGDVVEVGALIGVIGEPDEDVSDLVGSAGEGGGGGRGEEDEAKEEDAAEADDAEEAAEADADAADAGVAEGDAAEGDAAEGDAAEGDAAEGDAAEGDAAEGETSEEPVPDEGDTSVPKAPEARDGAPDEKATPAGSGGDSDSDADASKTQSSSEKRVKVSPLARRLAEEAGLELAAISGSGPGGRIIRDDVNAAIESGAARAQGGGEGAAGAGPVGPSRLADERIELSQMRKTIAKRLVQSLGPVPHFFLTTEIDMGSALDLRRALNERLQEGKVGVNDLLVKVAAEALARHPEINASFDGDAIKRHGSADIGIAVAVPDGLITPVLRAADRKGLVQIAAESKDLIERARNRKLKPDEYTGSTFSISNLGMFGIDEFTAIINPPEAAILAVGGTVEKPVVVDGEVVVRRRMRVTMSCDHRVIDGAMGAAFLQTFRAMLENPLELVS
ncbi:MAG: dihydrolipoamide acetyltransferase family protein [Gemmatimonadota bacterium]